MKEQKPIHEGCKELKCERLGYIKVRNDILCFGLSKKPPKKGDEIVYCVIKNGKVTTSYCTPLEALLFSSYLSNLVVRWLLSNLNPDDMKNTAWRKFIGADDE